VTGVQTCALPIFEQRAIRELRGVRMPESNWHGKRAAHLYTLFLNEPHSRLSCSDAGDLWFLVWRYRRQIENREVVAHADELMNGAKSLAF